MTEEFTVGVTGAAGYIGTRLIQELQDAHPDWNIVAIDNFYKGRTRKIGDTVIEHVDICDRQKLEESMGVADVICHLAAVSGVDDCDEHPELSYEVNVVGTNHVARLCHKNNTGLIFPASMAIFGDPDSFPITMDQQREALNWYARTKILGESAIERFAAGSFPAFVFVKSNLYGGYTIKNRRVSKGTVINFFMNRAQNENPLTVYEPGTQSRNFIHVIDVARAYVRGIEQLREQLHKGTTGVDRYAIASDSDPSVRTVAERVKSAAEKNGLETTVKLVENPRSGETMVEQFDVDTSKTQAELDWEPTWSIEETIHEQLSSN
jgi:nucleoside-diphosphate-sugar epimerase